ncbi:hypothetical protein [Pedobacter mendelii]|uniref:Lipocalin-like domain-containing protein n=1 Tax=Pedobacter mendelii TaxID=1908240 RepID=A0ABQ2BLB5_9SPHI|nr:hypothetical protein [Pedobacter mendelii]GGI26993.1 hypothetical protein GCM10008119_25430 [Pedobacter mendelii]
MKRQIATLCLILISTIILFSCKKDNTSVKARITGKWTVNKIEVSGNSNESLNGTFNYTINDYMDFKANNDDQVELGLNNQRTIGSYIISLGTEFQLVFPEGTYYCTVATLSGSQLQFTAKMDKTNVSKVFYLTR